MEEGRRPDGPTLEAWTWAAAFQGPEHQPFRLAGYNRSALLVHGFPGSAAEMRGLGDALHAAGWNAHGLTLPGFGPAIGSLASRRHAEWTEAVREAWRALPADQPRLLVGYSMGAALAIAVAAEVQPDACVLVAPLSGLLEGPMRLAWPLVRLFVSRLPVFELWAPRWDDPIFRESLAHWLPGVDLADPAVRAGLECFTIETRLIEQVLACGRASARLAPQVACPTLVVQGDRDALVTPQRTRRLLARFGGPLRYVEVAGEHEIAKAGQPGHAAACAAVLAFLHDQFDAQDPASRVRPARVPGR